METGTRSEKKTAEDDLRHPRDSRLCLRFIAVEVFDAGAGVKDDNALADVDLANGAERFERGETSGPFRCNKQTFLGSNFTRDPDHFLIVNRDGAAV